MGRSVWPRLSGWGLSRRAIASVFGSLSLLSSRPGLDLLAGASDMAEIAITGAIAYQLTVGGPTLGLHIAWVFVGYLVYAYTPELYLGGFGDVVEQRGFRAMTATLSVCFGVLFGQIVGVLPDAGVFALVPDQSGDVLLVMLGCYFTGIFVFNVYLRVWRHERLLAKDASHTEVMEWFTVRSRQETRREYQALPSVASKIKKFLDKYSAGSVYVVPCIVIGSVMAYVNAFYPIPEALILGGFVASYLPVPGRLRAALPINFEYDIEYRLADKATDALQNVKGFALAVIILSGLGICGIVFFSTFGYLRLIGNFPSAIKDFLTAVHSHGHPANWPLVDVAWGIGYFWNLFGLVLLGVIYSLYGLLYWGQQLRRLPRYVGYWEEYWTGDAKSPPTASVRRPPGLFLPGGALLAVFGGLIWMVRAAEPGLAVVWGLGLAWPSLVAVVGWSMYTTAHGARQSLAHEGRDIFFAFTIQFLAMLVLLRLIGSPPSEVDIFIVVMMGNVAYGPDVGAYANRHDGLANLLDVLYWGFWGVVTLAFVGAVTTLTPQDIVPLAIVLVVLMGLAAAARILMQYTEWPDTISDN